MAYLCRHMYRYAATGTKIVHAMHPLNIYIVAELSRIAIINVVTYIPARMTTHMTAMICLSFFISLCNKY